MLKRKGLIKSHTEGNRTYPCAVTKVFENEQLTQSHTSHPLKGVPLHCAVARYPRAKRGGPIESVGEILPRVVGDLEMRQGKEHAA